MSRKNLGKNTEYCYVLSRVFGKLLRISILELFLNNKDSYFNINEIARRLRKNPGSIYRAIPELVRDGLIEEIRISESRSIYRLNLNNPIVQELLKFYEKIRQIIYASQ
ncbi:MAG: hypothetical protein DRO23_06615 [Thermoprotei archaeon]|nr:MAG: hypothetical protein B6U76_04270 [Desulfurococcales archaeon ex4484_217_2]RLG74481.1 MAG: hypothetical protein DRO23_06615 [Thermoprotei archaeon]